MLFTYITHSSPLSPNCSFKVKPNGMLQTVIWRVNDEKLQLPGDSAGEEFRHDPTVNSSYGIKAFINVR